MKERKMLSLNAFRGVDLSSAPTMVNHNRASYSVNMINDNGINHRRPGWELLESLDGKINGMYHYVNGSNDVVIICAGGSFFAMPPNGLGRPIYTGLQKSDKKVQFFLHKERLYIIGCGDYLVYGTWDNGKSYKMQRVSEAEDTYVPTTLYVKDGVRETMDKVNIITRRRKNVFCGDNQGKNLETDSWFDKVRSFVVGNTEFTINENENKASLATSEKVVIKKESRWYSCNCFDAGITRSYFLPANDYSELYGAGDLYCSYCNSCVAKWEDLYTETDVESTIEVKFIEKTDKQFSGFKIPDDGFFNDQTITVEYDALTDHRDMVCECSFGAVFGASGNSDRLFLSGNSKHPNLDFHSEYDDFTYFTEGSQTAMGSDDVPITGYLRLSDSVLATLKADNVTEPTIYYRSAVEVETSDGYTDIEFTRSTGGINEGCVNPHTVVNLAGDDMFVSPSGVFGVVQIQNSTKNDRYIRQRDSLINAELRKRDLRDAVAFVYENRYYLSLGNGECYVADPRYKNYLSDDIDGSYNYEWWKWTNVPARVFCNVNGELWFGDSDGGVYRFSDRFLDEKKCIFENGELTYDDKGVFTYTGHDIAEGCKLRGDLQIKINVNGEFKAGRTKPNNTIMCVSDDVYDRVKAAAGKGVYVCNVGKSGLEENTMYNLVGLDDYHKDFYLTEFGTGTHIELKSYDFELYYVYQGDFFARGVDDDSFKISLTSEGNIIDRLLLASVDCHVKALPVRSEWYTPVFDLGAPHLHKTLLRLNITIDPNIRGALQVGYETNDKLAYIGANAGKVFSFEDFSFEDFSFATGFTVTQSQKVKTRNFNYIMFRFVSDNDQDCAVDNFSAEYIYNGGRFAGTR